MKNGFTAKRTTWNGIPGYTVTQWMDGEAVVEQFVGEDGYKEFCEFIGAVPEILEGGENANNM